jgi:hypothetical protein
MRRLTIYDLSDMRSAHAASDRGHCKTCRRDEYGEARRVDFPCAVALLLHHFDPGPAPHLAGVMAGLFGPVSVEELTNAPQP